MFCQLWQQEFQNTLQTVQGPAESQTGFWVRHNPLGHLVPLPTDLSPGPGSWVQIKLLSSTFFSFFSIKTAKVRDLKSFRCARVGEVFHAVPQLLWEHHTYRRCTSTAKGPSRAGCAFTQLTSQFSHCCRTMQQKITE